MEKGFPAPLFRDPIFDGASDPTVIWNKKEACYYMFYTQRRSTSVGMYSSATRRCGMTSKAAYQSGLQDSKLVVLIYGLRRLTDM